MSLYFFAFSIGFIIGYVCKFAADKIDVKNGKGVSFL